MSYYFIFKNDFSNIYYRIPEESEETLVLDSNLSLESSIKDIYLNSSDEIIKKKFLKTYKNISTESKETLILDSKSKLNASIKAIYIESSLAKLTLINLTTKLIINYKNINCLSNIKCNNCNIDIDIICDTEEFEFNRYKDEIIYFPDCDFDIEFLNFKTPYTSKRITLDFTRNLNSNQYIMNVTSEFEYIREINVNYNNYYVIEKISFPSRILYINLYIR